MELVRHDNAESFLKSAEGWLSATEAENNIALGVARRCALDTSASGTPEYWATVEENGKLLGCAFRTPPYLFAVTRLPQAAIAILAKDVLLYYGELPGVGGPIDTATAFAKAWSTQAGTKWEIRFRLLIHELTSVTFPDSPPSGVLRSLHDDETELVQEWAAAFVEDTGIRDTPESYAQRLLSSPNVFLWDDDGPRCMVAATRETPTGSCVNAVYTPAADRGKGYASAAVAALSEQILRSGKKFCCLYTDAANPTSNSIYRRIGYQPIREDVDIDFSRAYTSL